MLKMENKNGKKFVLQFPEYVTFKLVLISQLTSDILEKRKRTYSVKKLSTPFDSVAIKVSDWNLR